MQAIWRLWEKIEAAIEGSRAGAPAGFGQHSPLSCASLLQHAAALAIRGTAAAAGATSAATGFDSVGMAALHLHQGTNMGTSPPDPPQMP